MNDPGFVWGRSEPELRAFVNSSIRRALKGSTPPSLRALSFSCDAGSKRVRMKAHFERPHTADEFDLMMAVEGEVIADFPDQYVITTEFETAPLGKPIHPLSDDIRYLRDGEPRA